MLNLTWRLNMYGICGLAAAFSTLTYSELQINYFADMYNRDALLPLPRGPAMALAHARAEKEHAVC